MNSTVLRRWLIVLAGCGWLLSGCVGYRVGSTDAVGSARTVSVLPFQNETFEPGLTEEVTAAIRHRLQMDGTLRLVRQQHADIVVQGQILDYERRGLSFDPTDVRVPRDYELRLRARVMAIRSSDQKTILDRVVVARAAVRLAADQPTAEQQVLPILADDLARQVTSLLVDGSW